MNCGTAILNQPIDYELHCQRCETVVMITVHFTKLYEAMNLLDWTLIPTQHGREVAGVCPKCNQSPDGVGIEAGALQK